MTFPKHRAFAIADGQFTLDGEPFRLLSGTMHYFRVHPGHWEHRLAMLRAMGLNTVEFYVPWNMHELRPGVYARLDEIGQVLELARKAGLLAIVRPGPYICAEWDNGGLPSWLPMNRRIRTSDPEYLSHVDRWFDVLIPRIVPSQVTHGGNLIMVQVENEYGSYGSDQAYLRHLADGLSARGIDVPLFTSDGPEDHMLTGGTIPGVAATVNFGSGAREAFEALRRHRPDDPLLCMEFWNGWFDHWGTGHHTRAAAHAASALEEILAAGASVNIYVAHGGTSFGTWAGANLAGEHHDGAFLPTITSYDYDAPIDERGAPTEKFWRYREVLTRHGPDAPEPPPTPRTLEPMTVPLLESAPLRDAFGESVHSPTPLTFEELGIRHGLVRYRVDIPGPRQPYRLTADGLRDRAHVFVDGDHVATLERDSESKLDVAGPATVELLVESLGRVGYGPRMGEHKGITEGVRHERQYLHGFAISALALDAPPDVRFTTETNDVPALFRGEFEIAEPLDSFIALPGWAHGYVWVNGFCLGRYWDRGPQRTLYLPGPVLRTGTNEIIVLELDSAGELEVELRAEHDLGPAAEWDPATA